MKPSLRPLLAIALALTASFPAFGAETKRVIVSTVTTGLDAAPATTPAGLSWPDEKIDSWNGYKRHLFRVADHDCWVVEPKQAAPGNPWTWCTENPDAFTDRTGVPQLLAKGFYRVHIPIIHVVGDADDAVPPEDNSAIVEERYKKLGGEIVVIHKPGVGHHPHGLDDPKPLVDFIMKNAGPP